MVVEKQLLPNPALRPVYGKLVWVYVYRDFSGNEADRAAERILWRFGVSSWPQIFLADPATLEILAHTGRTPDRFLAAVARTKPGPKRDPRVLEAMAAAAKRADELERRPTVKLATRGIDDEDIVVRFLALKVLAKKDPRRVAARAAELLAVPNDPFRFEVCNVLKEHGDATARGALERLVRAPEPSLNPNVARIRAVQALARCGDARSVAVIAPHAASGDYHNGLTGVAVDALAEIARRDPKARGPVHAALKAAYPPVPDPGDARARRACVALAKRIHAALGEKRPFPAVYDETARRRLMR